MRKIKKNNLFWEGIQTKLSKYSRLAILFVILVLTLSLARNLSKAASARRTIEDKEREVEKVKKEAEDAKKRLDEASSDMYVEKQLRDTLGLVKEGEVVVILPSDDVLRSLSPKLDDEEETLPDPNWKRWMKLFM